MKYYLVTGKIPATEGHPEILERPEILPDPDKGIRYRAAQSYQPAIAPVPAHDSRIEIGESNPFDTSGKPFKIRFHAEMGIVTVDDWKRLFILYGTRYTHEFRVTPLGVVAAADMSKAIVPAFHLISLLNDGFSKEIVGDKLIYSKQKGRIEDDGGTTYTPDQMIAILESK